MKALNNTTKGVMMGYRLKPVIVNKLMYAPSKIGLEKNIKYWKEFIKYRMTIKIKKTEIMTIVLKTEYK